VAPESETHRIAVIKQDNGELQEDVVAREILDTADRREKRERDLDGTIDASFPASDPSAQWSGGDRDDLASEGVAEPDDLSDAAARYQAGLEERIIGSAPLEEVAGRSHPAAPVPGTLPAPES
jgi:hypothetical protein